MSGKRIPKLDFSIDSAASRDTRRKAYRATIPGLRAIVQQFSTSCKVRDISAAGVAFYCDEADPSKGDVLEVDFVVADKLLLSKAGVQVVRTTEDGLIGCMFRDLTLKQEAKLDKLVLEVQKRMISLRKKEQQEE